VVELFLRNFIQLFLVILWLMVLGRALLSWVDPTGRNQVSAFLVQTTEPILAPVRRLLPQSSMIDFSPQSSMIDFSPLIVLLILGALMRAF
jgi:YggT family protein